MSTRPQFQLIEACRKGDLKEVKLLVKGRVSIDVKDAFKWACAYGNLELVKYLIKQGADVYAHKGVIAIGRDARQVEEVDKYLELVKKMRALEV